MVYLNKFNPVPGHDNVGLNLPDPLNAKPFKKIIFYLGKL